MKKISEYILEIVVFNCGASLMIMELVGSRILAPYVGTSTIVWTSLIGIILGFLSLGYFLGGRLADKKAQEKTLSLIILLASFFVFLIIIINGQVLYYVRELVNDLYLASVLGTIILFAVPSVLLGVVSPYAIKLRIKSLDNAGKDVGRLYAVSTLGSIAGTFLAGFFLIPFLGTIKILYFITIVLALTSILISIRHIIKVKIASLTLFFICFLIPLSFTDPAKARGLIDIDTEYTRVWIYLSKAPHAARAILRLTTDPYSVQSAIFMDKDDDLVYRYAKFYRLADHFKKEIKNGLMIGGAAYSYPRDFLDKHTEAEITVVEIDPGMTEIAKKYFKLKESPRLNIVHEDGRVFLNKNQEKFDAIYLDAFTSRLSVPYQLTTVEAVQRVYDSLEDEGVVIFNIASSLSGEKSKFLQAELATYKEIFPQVYVFAVDTRNPRSTQNLMLVALKSQEKPDFQSDNKEYNDLLASLWDKEIEMDLPILTDDYAPVDYYIKELIH